ncbi:hypothetical protein ACQP2K_22115 [Microbispora siamensis]
MTAANASEPGGVKGHPFTVTAEASLGVEELGELLPLRQQTTSYLQVGRHEVRVLAVAATNCR